MNPLFSYLEKVAKTVQTTPNALQTTLLPHQQRVVDRLETQPGLVVAHGTGSGKTLTSIAAAVKFGPKKVTVVAPAALLSNYQKELKKHTGDATVPVELVSMQGAKGRLKNSDLLVIDEAHRIRNPSSKTYAIMNTAKANKRLLMTASPVYNL